MFEEREKVLCFQGPLIYEAKILGRCWLDKENKGLHYYVHYQGWKSSWDEWVPETRILRYNDENIQTQNRLRELYRMKQTGVNKNTYTQEGLDKRRRDVKLEKEEDYLRRPEIKVNLPDTLKGQLVDDWEYVTKNSKLVTLPKDVTVNGILERYIAYRKENRENRELNEEHLEKVCEGIRAYFKQSLSTVLLYRFERRQYNDIIELHPDIELVDIYGAEHLLRLIVQIPSLVAHTTMNTDSVQILVEHLTDLLGFMQKQQKQFFQTDYEYPPSDYDVLPSSSEKAQPV